MAIYDQFRLTRFRNGVLCLSFGAAVVAVLAFVLNLVSIEVSQYQDLHEDLLDLAIGFTLVPPVVTASALIAIGHNFAFTQSIPPPEAIREARSTTNLLAGGVAVTLTAGVLATAARWRMVEHFPGAEPLPPIVTVLYGAAFTAVVVATFVPAQTRLNRATDLWVEAQVAGRDPYDSETLKRRAALRAELASASSRANTFGPIVGVVAPIATASTSSLLA